MKKLIAVVCSLAMVMGCLSACGDKDDSSSDKNSSSKGQSAWAYNAPHNDNGYNKSIIIDNVSFCIPDDMVLNQIDPRGYFGDGIFRRIFSNSGDSYNEAFYNLSSYVYGYGQDPNSSDVIIQVECKCKVPSVQVRDNPDDTYVSYESRARAIKDVYEFINTYGSFDQTLMDSGEKINLNGIPAVHYTGTEFWGDSGSENQKNEQYLLFTTDLYAVEISISSKKEEKVDLESYYNNMIETFSYIEL